MATILSIPIELQVLIIDNLASPIDSTTVDYANYEDLRALCLTSHVLLNIAQPLLFRAFTTRLAGTPHYASIPLKNTLAPFVRTLCYRKDLRNAIKIVEIHSLDLAKYEFSTEDWSIISKAAAEYKVISDESIKADPISMLISLLFYIAGDRVRTVSVEDCLGIRKLIEKATKTPSSLPIQPVYPPLSQINTLRILSTRMSGCNCAACLAIRIRRSGVLPVGPSWGNLENLYFSRYFKVDLTMPMPKLRRIRVWNGRIDTNILWTLAKNACSGLSGGLEEVAIKNELGTVRGRITPLEAVRGLAPAAPTLRRLNLDINPCKIQLPHPYIGPENFQISAGHLEQFTALTHLKLAWSAVRLQVPEKEQVLHLARILPPNLQHLEIFSNWITIDLNPEHRFWLSLKNLASDCKAGIPGSASLRTVTWTTRYYPDDLEMSSIDAQIFRGLPVRKMFEKVGVLFEWMMEEEKDHNDKAAEEEFFNNS